MATSARTATGSLRATASPARRWVRRLGTALLLCGLAAVAWTATVWLWQDPGTGTSRLCGRTPDHVPRPVLAHRAAEARRQDQARDAIRNRRLRRYASPDRRRGRPERPPLARP